MMLAQMSAEILEREREPHAEHDHGEAPHDPRSAEPREQRGFKKRDHREREHPHGKCVRERGEQARHARE
jgi:hypothetical protein